MNYGLNSEYLAKVGSYRISDQNTEYDLDIEIFDPGKIFALVEVA
jgi:hypothetical protein